MTVKHQLAKNLQALQTRLTNLEIEYTELKNLVSESITNISEQLDEDALYNPFREVTLAEQSLRCNNQPLKFVNDSKQSTLDSIINTFNSMSNGSVSVQFRTDTQANKVHSSLFSDRTNQDLPPYKRMEATIAFGRIIQDNVNNIITMASFPDKFLEVKTLNRGEVGRIEVKRKDKKQVFVTNDPNVLAQQTRQSYVYPPEFYTIMSATLDDRKLEQLDTEALFNDLLEQATTAIISGLNSTFLKLVRTIPEIRGADGGPLSVPHSNLSPEIIDSFKKILPIADARNTKATLLLSRDTFLRVAANTKNFLEYWTPPVSVTEFTWGSLGTLYGLRLHTDPIDSAYHTLKTGDAFLLGEPNSLGAVTLRKSFNTKFIDRYNQGTPEFGWFGERVQGMAIVNCEGLATINFE